ncbi:MAG: hypothetical protein SOY99_05705 [Alloprevotella sp.]|nr:hypothetical protein [Alloprevotella sp.]
MEEIVRLSEIFSDSVCFVEQTLFGHKRVNAILGVYVAFTMYLSSIIKPGLDIYSMAKPLAKWKVWLYWLFAGLWGGHWEYLNIKIEEKSSYKGIWISISLFSIIVILILLSYKLFESQFIVVTILLYLLLFINVICGIGRISYSTNKFNARYYRRYIDTDLILNNEKLNVDRWIKDFSSRMKKFGENLRIANAIVEDKEYGYEDADTSFFKNLATFGNYNKLQREKSRLKFLAETSVALQDEIKRNKNIQGGLEIYLDCYRAAAYRNISLCKELLGLLKIVEGQKQSVIKDVSIEIPQYTILDSTKFTSFRSVDFDTESFSKGVMSSVEQVSKSLSDIQNRGDSITKADLTCSLVEIGLTAVGEGISGIIDLNTETTNQRAEVNHKIAEVTDSLETLVPQLNIYRAKFLRQIEVLVSLKEMNSAFIKVYEPLRKGVFNDEGGYTKSYNYFIASDHFKKQLGILVSLCSAYSKINKSSQ